VLYLWDLFASGYANGYYANGYYANGYYANGYFAAAVQAGTQSIEAWLFGSLDAGNAITVDKPPAALWIMALSARIFGFSSWSLLVPQAPGQHRRRPPVQLIHRRSSSALDLLVLRSPP
jgi:hypothetical protein